jgi:phage tail-like protein
MKVANLKAAAAPDGRVTLTWRTPAGLSVRVLRGERRYPSLDAIDHGLEVNQLGSVAYDADAQFVDGPLPSETVFYYSVVTYDAAGHVDVAKASVLTLAPYGTADEFYQNLPQIYRLLDRGGSGDGPLRRLMEIFARPFDELRSHVAAMRDLHDIERVDGALLPLLAQWIGQASDTTLNLDRQRNVIRYAPQYFRTAGVPANLRAAVNRYINWDVRLREMVHSVAITNHPECLTLWQMRRSTAGWSAPQNVNLDVAFEGRVAPFATADGRDWVVYHARRPAPAATTAHGRSRGDGWHLFAKVTDGAPQAAIRLTTGDDLYKHPSVVVRPGGGVWMFYTRYGDEDGQPASRIGLQVLSIGRPARPAERIGSATGRHVLADGTALRLALGASGLEREIVIREENLTALAAGPEEIAAVIDRELPDVDAFATPDGRVGLRSRGAGGEAVFDVDGTSPLAATLGLADGPATGWAAVPATLLGETSAPFVLADEATLTLAVDRMQPRTLTFDKRRFADIAQATAAEVVAEINRAFGPIAAVDGDAVRLTSRSPGAVSALAVHVDASSAAPALGFGVPLPRTAGTLDEHPSAAADSAGNIWLAWVSRRPARREIRISRLAGGTWAGDKPLSDQPAEAMGRSNSEPFLLFHPDGRCWVFWTRRKTDGRHTILWRSTTQLDFAALSEADWTEDEYQLAWTDGEARDASAIAVEEGAVELYVSRSRLEGWDISSRLVAPGSQQADAMVIGGPASRRFPCPALLADKTRALYLRSNQSQIYTSKVYPDATTLDAQYSGSTTVDFASPDKHGMRGSFDDLQRYTMDTRRPEDDQDAAETQTSPAAYKGLFSRDVVGVYLKPDTEDQKLVLHQRRLLTDGLRRLLPIQVRLAFLVGRSDEEEIYTYGKPGPGTLIGESMIDTLLGEVIGQPTETVVDTFPNVRFLRTWAPGETSVIPDLAPARPDLSSRLFVKSPSEGK